MTRHGISSSGDVVGSHYLRQAELEDAERLLGFTEHFVADMGTDPRANRGLDEVTRLGDELLEEWWREGGEGSNGSVGNG